MALTRGSAPEFRRISRGTGQFETISKGTVKIWPSVNVQVIQLPAVSFNRAVDISGGEVFPYKEWDGLRVTLDDALTSVPGSIFSQMYIGVRSDTPGIRFVHVETNNRFSTDVENDGVFTLASGANSVDFKLDGTMRWVSVTGVRAYQGTPSNAAGLLAFWNAIGSFNVAATLTIRDGAK